MNLGTYRVHSVLKVPQRAVVKHRDQDISATIDMLEVVLASTDPSHGSLVVRYYGKEADEAAGTFKTDEVISLSAEQVESSKKAA